jgi:hypothetical protein
MRIQIQESFDPYYYRYIIFSLYHLWKKNHKKELPGSGSAKIIRQTAKFREHAT